MYTMGSSESFPLFILFWYSSTSISNRRSLFSTRPNISKLMRIQSMQKPMKNKVRGERRRSFTSSAVYSVYVVFALTTMVAQPTEIQTKAVKSYFQINFSPRIQVEKIMAATIELAELAAIRVKSRYLMRYTCAVRQVIIASIPSKNLHEQ